MKLTLAEWQRTLKPIHEFIVQASSTDGKDAWQSFPIGMGYHWVHHKDNPLIQLGDHKELLYVALNPLSDKGRRGKSLINRRHIINTLASRGFGNLFTTGQEYFTSLPKYKFIASPEGNGIDTHRTYEALVAGCIPIVEDNPEICKKYQGLPILYTRDYREISKSYLRVKYEEMLNQTYDFSRLFTSFYTQEEQQKIKECSEYWLQKLVPVSKQ
jgi:hypothetical protein